MIRTNKIIRLLGVSLLLFYLPLMGCRSKGMDNSRVIQSQKKPTAHLIPIKVKLPVDIIPYTHEYFWINRNNQKREIINQIKPTVLYIDLNEFGTSKKIKLEFGVRQRNEYQSTEINDCFFENSIDLTQRNKIHILKPKCKTSLISWPESWGRPIAVNKEGYVDMILTDGFLWVLIDKKVKKPIVLDWGETWEKIDIDDAQLNKSYIKLTSKLFRPRWPLKKNEPWLKTTKGKFSNPCEAPVQFKVKQIKYCLDQKNKILNCIDSPLKIVEGKPIILPNLWEIHWNPLDQLPAYGALVLENTSLNPKYQDEIWLKWSLKNGHIDQAASDLIPSGEIQKLWPVSIQLDSHLSFDFGAKILVFENSFDCENLKQAKNEAQFSAYGIEQLRVTECDFIKLVRGNRRVSKCAYSIKQNDKLFFQLESALFNVPRKIIVIANSYDLGAQGRGLAIKEALIQFLKELKHSDNKIPLVLLSFEVYQKVKELIYGEDLIRMHDSEQNDQIQKLIEESLIFRVSGFNPLEDLNLIGRYIFNNFSEVESVLYFTEGKISSSTTEFDVSTNLGWFKDKKIQLNLITKENQEWWAQHDGISSCKTLSADPSSSEILKYLKAFIR